MPRVNRKFKNFIKDSWGGDFFIQSVRIRRDTVRWFKRKTVKKIRKYLKHQES